MSPKKIKVVFRKLGRERALGQAHHGDSLIEIDPRQKGKEALDTACHEVLHLLFKDEPEEAIGQAGMVMADTLWKIGYRKVEL